MCGIEVLGRHNQRSDYAVIDPVPPANFILPPFGKGGLGGISLRLCVLARENISPPKEVDYGLALQHRGKTLRLPLS